jgi:hypothetical protein
VLADDRVEQARLYRAEQLRLSKLRFGEACIRAEVDWDGVGALASDPASIVCWWKCAYREVHVWEAIAAEHRGLAIVDAGPVGLQVQLRRHAVQRVDHAAQPRHGERVHDGRRSQGEMHRHANRHDESAH